ncbi:MAG: BadF/BadG/BcrA/BcrD ATPase family protein [Asticcacaulis sp.]
MICGWAGSLAGADGINIVAGTGSIGYGERLGRGARAGGWGEVFSDEGSAYWIAVQGLAAFARMSDGRLAKGPLQRHSQGSFRPGRRSRPVRQGDGRRPAVARPDRRPVATRRPGRAGGR